MLMSFIQKHILIPVELALAFRAELWTVPCLSGNLLKWACQNGLNYVKAAEKRTHSKQL